jgi:hypothetical protein
MLLAASALRPWMTILQIEVSVKDTSVCIVDGTGKITREEIRSFSNNATITVAPADCWWRLRPAVRLQLATGPAVPERYLASFFSSFLSTLLLHTV